MRPRGETGRQHLDGNSAAIPHCRTPRCTGIWPSVRCQPSGGGWAGQPLHAFCATAKRSLLQGETATSTDTEQPSIHVQSSGPHFQGHSSHLSWLRLAGTGQRRRAPRRMLLFRQPRPLCHRLAAARRCRGGLGRRHLALAGSGAVGLGRRGRALAIGSLQRCGLGGRCRLGRRLGGFGLGGRLGSTSFCRACTCRCKGKCVV